MLTLINGEKIVVIESCDDVVNRTIAYRASVYSEAAGYLQALAWPPTSAIARVPEPNPRRSAIAGDPEV
jgi:hypothetical protein